MTNVLGIGNRVGLSGLGFVAEITLFMRLRTDVADLMQKHQLVCGLLGPNGEPTGPGIGERFSINNDPFQEGEKVHLDDWPTDRIFLVDRPVFKEYGLHHFMLQLDDQEPYYLPFWVYKTAEEK